MVARLRFNAFLRLSAAIVLIAACSDTTTPTANVSPGVDSEANPSAASPATTTSLPPLTATQCGDPHAHIYSPDRLQLLDPCVTVIGTVALIRSEKDGDLHVLLRLDPGQSTYVNAANVSGEQGDLVLEPVCVSTPTQTDAIAPCADYTNPLSIPAVGTHVAVTGAWVLDLDHGWMEIHPVSAFNAAPAATPASPSPIPSPSPSPTPTPVTAPVVNVCGAPANPWNYNYCGGNLIASPAADICQYFACISSFWNGTGYVVQCVDGKLSKSGGRTGVCSQHGGFRQNLYSP